MYTAKSYHIILYLNGCRHIVNIIFAVPDGKSAAAFAACHLLYNAMRAFLFIFVAIEVHGECAFYRLMAYDIVVGNGLDILHNKCAAKT